MDSITIVVSDGNRGKGGLAFIIKDDVKFKLREDFFLYGLKMLFKRKLKKKQELLVETHLKIPSKRLWSIEKPVVCPLILITPTRKSGLEIWN